MLMLMLSVNDTPRIYICKSAQQIHTPICTSLASLSFPVPHAHSQLRPLLLQIRTILIPQKPSQNLPTGTLRDHIDKLDTPLQPLMSRLLLLNERDNVLCDVFVGFAGGVVGGFDDEGFGDFAGGVVLAGDYSAVCYGGVGEEG